MQEWNPNQYNTDDSEDEAGKTHSITLLCRLLITNVLFHSFFSFLGLVTPFGQSVFKYVLQLYLSARVQVFGRSFFRRTVCKDDAKIRIKS